MKPLICPQCGGKVTDYHPNQMSVQCTYCDTKFIVTPEREEPVPAARPLGSVNRQKVIIAAVGGGAFLFLVLMFGMVLVTNSRKTTVAKPLTIPAATPYPTVKLPAPPASEPDLLRFGGEGLGEGQFQEAGEIAVGSDGSIYVADESLRVQKFGPDGKFIKLWQIPKSTANYKRAEVIQKLALEGTRLYVLVGGVILIYEGEATEPSKAIHFAPQAIQDFALRADGGIYAIVNFDEIEVLVQMNRAGKVLKRTRGFLSEIAEPSVNPYETAIASIRVAVDGAGNLYSVFAFGDLGSYSASMDTDDFQIFRFGPDGRYINRFYKNYETTGIVADTRGRVYVSERNSILAIAPDGTLQGFAKNVPSVSSFNLDKDGYIYIVTRNEVIKRAPIQ